MNRLTVWVFRHPGRDRRASWPPWSLPLSLGMFRLRYEIELHQPVPARDAGSSSDYHAVESRLGGIGLVELVVPVGPTVDARDARPSSERLERTIAAIRRRRPAVDRPGPLAGDGARPRRPARRPARRAGRADPGGTSST